MPNGKTFINTLAGERNQPIATFEAFFRVVNEVVGVRLLTLTTFDVVAGHARRVYSNMPIEYPISGTKPVRPTRWTDKVIGNHENFVANTLDELSEVFEDFELIESLRCGSVLNVPIVVAGKLLGTVNCLHSEHYFTQERVSAIETLNLNAAACFMLLAQNERKGEQT